MFGSLRFGALGIGCLGLGMGFRVWGLQACNFQPLQCERTRKYWATSQQVGRFVGSCNKCKHNLSLKLGRIKRTKHHGVVLRMLSSSPKMPCS